MCLLSKNLQRVPNANERKTVVTVVHRMYNDRREAQPQDVDVALRHLRTNARIKEIVDLNLNVKLKRITPPSSFVGFAEFISLLKASKSVVCDTGVFLYFNRKVSFIQQTDCVSYTRKKLREFLKDSKNTTSITFFE
jgi:hypothetical protein